MSTPPLVIVVLDAGEPDLILQLARDGTLPAIGDVLGRGTCATLAGRDMAAVHGTWTSILSGLSLAEHGRYAKRILVPGTYELRPLAACRPVPAPFWASLRETGRRVVVVDAPGIGLVPGLGGAQLADWGRDEPDGTPVTEPTALAADLQRRFGRPLGVDQTPGTLRRDRRMRQRLLDRIARKGALVRHLLGTERTDLIVVGFADTHTAGHRFRAYGPAHGELGGTLRDVYRAIDSEVGLVLAALGEPANVVVLSNGGIVDGQPTWDLMDGFCRALGYQVVRADGAWRRAAGDLLRRAAARALPRRWSHGDALPRTLAGVDWSRTAAFAVPSYYTGLVRVNLVGREPSGTVHVGAEYDALLDRLEEDLRALRHPDTGHPVVARVTRIATTNGGTPPSRLPDLFVDWKIAPPAAHIVHPRVVLWSATAGTPRPNHHARSGLVIAGGPAVTSSGACADVSPSALAPLLLALLNGGQVSWRGAEGAA